MALTIKPATLNTELNNLNNTINNVIKPATINEHNLSLNDLNNELKRVIKTRTTTPKIKDLINIYEQSTRPSTTPSETTHSEQQQDETTPINHTKALIRFLINRNRADATRLNLTHFKNIRCKDNNNKSCIIPIYKTPENREDQNKAEQSRLLIHTINYKYFIFIRDIYNITYKNLLERMDGRYKINVGLFKE
jgi:hypothetical protein